MSKTYRPAVFFILRYVLLYLVLNTGYAFYVNHFRPGPDPVTVAVTKHSASLLNFTGETVTVPVTEESINVPLARNGSTVVEVFEGCNGVNVMIVYVCFLIAFRGPMKKLATFAIVGVVVIYFLNLARVSGLYGIAYYYPDHLYFFHKYFFTGVLYAFVFAIWFLWAKKVSQWTAVSA